MRTNNITSVPDGRNVTANNEEVASNFQQGTNEPSELRDDRNGKSQDSRHGSTHNVRQGYSNGNIPANGNSSGNSQASDVTVGI